MSDLEADTGSLIVSSSSSCKRDAEVFGEVQWPVVWKADDMAIMVLGNPTSHESHALAFSEAAKVTNTTLVTIERLVFSLLCENLSSLVYNSQLQEDGEILTKRKEACAETLPHTEHNLSPWLASWASVRIIGVEDTVQDGAIMTWPWAISLSSQALIRFIISELFAIKNGLLSSQAS